MFFLANKLSGEQSGDGPRKEKLGNDKLSGEALGAGASRRASNVSSGSFSDALCAAIKIKFHSEK